MSRGFGHDGGDPGVYRAEMSSPSQDATRTFTIARPGGELLVRDLSGPHATSDAPLIVLVHGITANGVMWRPVARALAESATTAGSRIWAPDLRGRAGSRALPGPYGLAAHVSDLAALADHAGADRVVLAGHSMGGFISALAGVLIPDRLIGEVLVDGGPAFAPPGDVDIDTALHAVIGPAMTRLSMRFAGPEGYLDFWRPHPAVGPALESPAGADVTAYVLTDLVPAGDGTGEWVSSCVLDAIRADGRDLLVDARTHGGVRQAAEAGLPIEFIWAERGLMNEPVGLYSAERIAAFALPDSVRVTAVPGVNHYSVLFDPAGISAIQSATERVLTSAES